MTTQFSIHVAKENLKFSAAHFIASPGFREPLHGHNYQVGVYVDGRLAKTGYVIDFGLIKKLTKEIVDRLGQMERSGLTGISLLPPAEYQRKVFRDFAELVMPRMR